MSLISNIGWFATHCRKSEIEGKRVLDVGSRCWDITPADYIKDLSPSEYIGADVVDGDDVDVICDANNLVEKFGAASFDVVVSFEMLEHTPEWKVSLKNMMDVLKPGGLIFITTRTYGFPEHGYPDDYWRFDASDFEKIFSGFNILNLEQDDKDHGVYIKAKKPMMIYPWDDLEIFSMKHQRRVKS